jgi:hypothetical protein
MPDKRTSTVYVFQVVSSGAYLLAQAESKLQNNRGLTEQDESSTKSDRREERRKKASGGKGGGGTQVSNTIYCVMEYHIHQSNTLPLHEIHTSFFESCVLQEIKELNLFH